MTRTRFTRAGWPARIAILLIAACLSDGELAEFHDLARQLGLTALVEIHDRQELERVLRIQPALIGINNRDLHTFQVSLDTTAALRKEIPGHICVVAESGIHANGISSGYASWVWMQS